MSYDILEPAPGVGSVSMRPRTAPLSVALAEVGTEVQSAMAVRFMLGVCDEESMPIRLSPNGLNVDA